MKRTDERTEFLSDLLTMALEHCGYGFPGLIEYRQASDDSITVLPRAVIFDRYDDEPLGTGTTSRPTWEVTIETMAKGIGILRKKYGTTGSHHMRDLFEADRENDAGITDVVGALAVLEAAVFGDVTYN